MEHTFGYIINTEDLSSSLIKRLAKAGINELGIHPGGGRAAGRLLNEAREKWQNAEYQALLKEARGSGLYVGLEAHVLSVLLPRSEFDAHPEMFRMDESGKRMNDFNMCVSSQNALELISKNAAELARLFRSNTHRYAFWPDDVTGYACHCPECLKLSVSDQALLITNAIARGVRSVDPEAKVPYLAYYETLDCPVSVKPEEGVYLEYAPIDRDSQKPINSPENARVYSKIEPLMKFFGAENSRVLEYWIDNSRFSDWTRPPKPLTLDAEVMRKDMEVYKASGFEDFTSFACFLGSDYEEMYGIYDVTEYAQILRSALD